MRQRSLAIAGLFVMFFLIAAPLDVHGQTALELKGFVEKPSVSNTLKLIGLGQAKFNSCADEEAGQIGEAVAIAKQVKKQGERVVKAIASGGVSEALGGGNEEQLKILKKICDEAKNQVRLEKERVAAEKKAKLKKTATAVAYKNAITVLFNTLAYRTAVALTSGGRGMSALFETNYSTILKEAGNNALGEFLNKELGRYWKGSLCEPFTPFAKLNINLTVRGIVEPKAPRCTFTQIFKTLEGDLRNIQLKDLAQIQDYFNPSGNDLGATLTILSNLETRKKETEDITKLRKGLEGDFKSLTSNITGIIKTPASLIRESTEEYLIRGGTSPYRVYTGEALADAIGVFTNTLAGKMLQKVFNKGFNTSADIRGGNLFSLANVGVQAAAQKFVNLLLQPDLRGGGSVEILQQLVRRREPSAPLADTEPNDCVIDEKFRLAVEQKLTLHDAIAGPSWYIDPTKPFGSIKNGQKKDSNACDDPGVYSLRSISILRKYRIVPVGWELAAKYIAEVATVANPGKIYNLNYLISKYSDPTSPFYRLVDEYWVLKAPETFVRRRGFFPVTESEIITNDETGDVIGNRVTRGESDIDEQSCIFENPDGSCRWFGYCTEEKPIWKIQGDECPAYFNSCRTLTKSSGETLSLLVNTADQDPSCAFPEAIGCREYCSVYNSVQNEFQCAPAKAGISNLVYTTCNPGSAAASTCACTMPSPDTRSCSIQRGGFYCRVAPDPARKLPAAVCTLGTEVYRTPYSPTSRLGPRVYANAQAPECSASSANCNQYIKLADSTGKSMPGTGSGSIEETIAGAPVGANLSYYRSKAVITVPIYLKGNLQLCSAEYAGCDLFTPLNGEPPIPGIAGATCSPECAGFRSYKEGYSYFDAPNATPAWPEFRPKPQSAYLIASKGQKCSASSNGCEEFTNLEASVNGGEQKEYFTYLRQCMKPDGATEQVYYTWEGTDTTGFQLKEWLLKPEGSAPVGVACGAETPTDVSDDPEVEADCRQFYNTQAQVSWRLQSTTVFVSDECKQYRRTKDPNGPIWNAIPSQAKRCSASENMCLQYKGVNANNVRIVKLGNSRNGIETFDDGNADGWSQGSSISSESSVAGGKSLLVSGSVRTTTSLNLKQGAVYQLSFWVKASTGSAGTDAVSVDLVTSAARQTFVLGNDNVTATDWKYLSATLQDPGYLTSIPDSDNKTYLEFIGVGSFYLDNITLRETPDSLFLIQNSWQDDIPPICLGDAAANIPPQLNCQEYKNSHNERMFIRDFEKLCPLEFVGCTAMVDTKNSNLISASPTIRGVATPADSLAYAIDNPDNYCPEEAKGCLLLGQEGYDQGRDQKTTAAYRILDPDHYQQTLCTKEQNFCDEWSDEQTLGSLFFKDPANFLCEFKTGVTGVTGGLAAGGWFIKGSNAPCPTLEIPNSDPGVYGHCFGGRSTTTEGRITNSCRTNADCTNHVVPGLSGYCIPIPYTALCPGGESSCSEFQDPQRPVGCDKGLLYAQGIASGSNPSTDFACDYYYYLKENLDSSGCTKQNPNEGCVGFLDTANSPSFSTQGVCVYSSGPNSGSAILDARGEPTPCTSDSTCENGRCGYP